MLATKACAVLTSDYESDFQGQHYVLMRPPRFDACEAKLSKRQAVTFINVIEGMSQILL